MKLLKAGNIPIWCFHIISVCSLINGNKEKAPQNNSVHPDYVSVNSFNGFPETSGAVGFWENMTNLLLSRR